MDAKTNIGSKEYKYVGLDNKEEKVILPKELADQAIQATKDFDTSYRYIQSQYYYTWRYALKAYHLSTFDRKTILKPWQSNIAVGLIRSFVDVLVAAVQERPLSFIGTPINKKGLENKDNIIQALDYVADVTSFHRTIKQTLKDGLILGTVCLRVGYIKTKKTTKITSMINDKAVETVVETADEDIKNYPYAKSVPIFNIYPDPYTGKLRYITERGVISHLEFMETFGAMINSKENKSPFKTSKFLMALPKKENENQASFIDNGIITNQIHQKVNEECRERDKFSLQTGFNRADTSNQTSTQDEDNDVTNGLIEFKYTTYDDRIILHANNYPVYIGINFFGFINYVIKSAGGDQMRFGEGIPYMMK